MIIDVMTSKRHESPWIIIDLVAYDRTASLIFHTDGQRPISSGWLRCQPR